jgi:hypothetical protein
MFHRVRSTCSTAAFDVVCTRPNPNHNGPVLRNKMSCPLFSASIVITTPRSMLHSLSLAPIGQVSKANQGSVVAMVVCALIVQLSGVDFLLTADLSTSAAARVLLPQVSLPVTTSLLNSVGQPMAPLAQLQHPHAGPALVSTSQLAGTSVQLAMPLASLSGTGLRLNLPHQLDVAMGSLQATTSSQSIDPTPAPES